MSSDINLGIITFYASIHKIDECESNGLPRLPYSVNIIGKFEELKSLYHPNLCQYLDAKRDKHERIVIATEYYNSNFSTTLPDITKLGKQKYIEIFYRLASAIEYLHNSGLIARNICPKNIFWTNDDNMVKIVNHGLYFMTNFGTEIDFLIGYLPYLPPECILDMFNREKSRLSCGRSDVWSIGILMLQGICKGILPEILTDLKTAASFILECFLSNRDILSAFNLDECDSTYHDLLALVAKCLKLDVSDRISISDLKQQLIFLQPSPILVEQYNGSDNEKMNRLNVSYDSKTNSNISYYFHDSKERYYFWTLTGGDIWRCQSQMWDNQKKMPSILTLPILIRKDGEEYWSSSIAPSVKQTFCNQIWPLCGDKLAKRLSQLPKTVLHEPKLMLPQDFKPFQFDRIDLMSCTDKDEIQIRSQPVWVKEKDFEYQFRRVMRLKRLLSGYPLTQKCLFTEASYDIPPLLRGEMWPLLLGVDSTVVKIRYSQVQGKMVEDKAASQISVDLPRCHSYDEFIVSTSGQEKLSRILHAWLLHNPYLEYTQGMDSLCAVFVRLLFNQEALAFGCLEAFVHKFMRGLFCTSHGQALNEYCQVLQQLLAFHKPHLSQAVNIFSITGFTASWIYTGFAHSLSLDKTLRLWDTVILGEPSFLMMIFIALLGQLDQESDFSSQAAEQVFSVLSNLQEFDLDHCRSEAIELARKTPPSITYRIMATDSTVVAKLVDPQNICVSPRISLNDLLILLGETNAAKSDSVFSPFSFCPNSLFPPILIDLRIKENFQKGSIPGSRHLPIFSASPHTTFAELEAQKVQSIISDASNNMKIIISTVDDSVCDMVAKILVNIYHSQYVCILKGGINAVHDQRPDILIVTH